MSELLQKGANEGIARFLVQIVHSLICSPKTSDSLRKPMSKFPALLSLSLPALFHIPFTFFLQCHCCGSVCRERAVVYTTLDIPTDTLIAGCSEVDTLVYPLTNPILYGKMVFHGQDAILEDRGLEGTLL